MAADSNHTDRLGDFLAELPEQPSETKE